MDARGGGIRGCAWRDIMNQNRRDFLRRAAIAGSALALPGERTGLAASPPEPESLFDRPMRWE